MGYSKRETDWLGNERTVHYDDDGNVTGYSTEEEGLTGPYPRPRSPIIPAPFAGDDRTECSQSGRPTDFAICRCLLLAKGGACSPSQPASGAR